MLDIAIIGSGPAGLSAAINGVIRNKEVKVFGTDPEKSSYLRKAEKIDNYLGMPGISGEEMIRKFVEHAKEMGVQFHSGRVIQIFQMDDYFTLNVENEFIDAKTIILANGIVNEKAIEGETEFLGRGVSYCATCDGPLYRGKTAVLVGDSEAAEEDVNYLAEVCEKVYYVPLHKKTEKVDSRVEVIHDKPVAIEGEETVKTLKLKDNEELNVNGVFIIKDTVPTTQLLQGIEIVDKAIKVNQYMETNLKGVYAAGDCTGRPFQVAKAVGQGTTAALQAVSYLHKNS
ncbi:NAD(P)/FAD-dependent oxidoreductase [Candidatus Epulonipiscium viviparus]|uniref:NAD(P)/FAD-dependent oxidoreductase n=1 Tax=Candidatus Epulonipiscium viviparus TaxID=420336 RepID=UPI00016C0D93|nr:NAD(P)/FAD-dependent oxidoreductase [Candidatus Epulopiscium viviparus]